MIGFVFTCKVTVLVFNATFINNSVISCGSAFLVVETEVPEGNNRPVVRHCQTLSLKAVVKYPEVIPEVNRACFHHCLYIVSAYKETWAFMVVIVWEFDLHLPSSVMCVYHRLNCEFASRSWCGVVDTTLSYRVGQRSWW
jgi:hypothetical protein